MRRDGGFSMVEVTLAIGVVAVGLLAVFALVPVGLNSGRDAMDATRSSLIQQDVFNRVRGAINTSQLFTTPPTLSFYYTSEGIFFSDQTNLAAAISTAQTNKTPLPNYKASVNVGNSWAAGAPASIDPAYLKPVVVSLGSPLDSSGNVVGSANTARSVFTFYLRKP
jgi:uncharacterized protein (TIGR02598 family)